VLTELPLVYGESWFTGKHADRSSLESMDTAPDVDFGSIWLFSGCSTTQLRTIRRAVEEVAVPPNRVLCAEGAPGHEFSFIVDGTADVRRQGRLVASLGPGEYFGELALLDRRPRSASVVSSSAMRLLVLDENRFEALLQRMPGLATNLMAAMASRLRHANTAAFS